MSIDTTTPPSEALTLARQFVYRFFSLATSDPRSQRWNDLLDEGFAQTAVSATQFLRDEHHSEHLAPGEISPEALNLAPLLSNFRNPAIDINSQYEQIFGLMMSKKCPPYETEYCPQTFSVFRSQSLADIAGFYRAFGLEPSRDMPERADHISLELDFMSWLIAKEERAATVEQASVCRDAQRSFVRDHLAWWVPAFARALRRQSERLLEREDGKSSFYTLLAQNLAAFIPVERAVLDIPPPVELVAPGPIEPQEEMSCSACIGSCQTQHGRSHHET